MMRLTRIPLLAVAAAALVAASLAWPAHADDDHGRGPRTLVVKGVITAVDHGSHQLTIHREAAGDAAAADVHVRLSADSRVEPRGAVPAVDMGVKAVLLMPADDHGVYAVRSLVLDVHPDRPGHDQPHKALRACGTIAALPDHALHGQWTVSVPDLADLTFLVNGRTKVTPPHTTPAVGDAVCVVLRHSSAGWLAESVQLKRDRHAGDDHGRRVELHGTVKELPNDHGVMTIEVKGHGEVAVVVNDDTAVEGELTVGAKVAVRAEMRRDSAGHEFLLALKVKVLTDRHPGGKDHHAAVVLRGVVTAVDGAVWTITHGDKITQVTVDASTKIVGLAADEDPTGREVKGVAKPQADGSLLAVMLHVKRH